MADSSEATYYQQCAKIKLDRQVGSRYFVTAANAGKVFFMREAAIRFLKYTGKENGNKLERTVFQKLQDSLELAHLKADALLFHHVYCDLVMLAKSTTLNKNVLDMNKHYLEIQTFLFEVERYPEAAMDRNHQVFPSEKRHYGKDRNVNHRLHPSYEPVEEVVFSSSETDEPLLYPLLHSGAASMNAKLSSYAQNQLPGGKYWEPESDIASVLESLKPNNDVCESILGLNDYLSMVIPNLHQMSKSNLVQAKKNKTVQWLDSLPSNQQRDIVELARKSRVQVRKAYNSAADDRRKFRQAKMIQEKKRRDALQKRAAEEKARLSKIHLITSVEKLQDSLSKIDSAEQKRALLREQINVRKKVCQESINIPFTRGSKTPTPSEYYQRILSSFAV
jgi:E1A/CREB-binding protein